MTDPVSSSPPARPSRARVVFDWILGLTLLALGVLGFLLPILQGWLFTLAGLAVLSSHNRYARAIYERLKGAGRKMRDKIKTRRESANARTSGGSDGKR